MEEEKNILRASTISYSAIVVIPPDEPAAAVKQLLEGRKATLLAELPFAHLAKVHLREDVLHPGLWLYEINFPPTAASGRMNMADMTIMIREHEWLVVGTVIGTRNSHVYRGPDIDAAIATAKEIMASLPPDPPPPTLCRWCKAKVTAENAHLFTAPRTKQSGSLCDVCNGMYITMFVNPKHGPATQPDPF
jgi:hypothetical protein